MPKNGKKKARRTNYHTDDKGHFVWENLYDDLHIVHLDETLIAAPPLELWPEFIARAEMPADVQKELISSRLL